MGKNRDYGWLDKQKRKDSRDTNRAKLKFIKEIKKGLGEEIKESTKDSTKQKSFIEKFIFRLKKVFG